MDNSSIFGEVSQLYQPLTKKQKETLEFPKLSKTEKEVLQDSLRESINICKPLFHMFFDSLYKRIKEMAIKNPNIVSEYESAIASQDYSYFFIEEFNPLQREQQVRYEINQAKKSLTEKIHAHKIVRCFQSDELFQQIVTTLSDCVLSRLDEVNVVYQQRQDEVTNSTQSALMEVLGIQPKKQPLDPVKLEAKVQELKEKLHKQTKDFHKELDYYRNIFARQNLNQYGKETRELIEVRYFDETDLLDPEMQSLMNQKIREIQNQYSQLVQTQLKTQKNLLIRLHQYERLRPECHYLIDIPVHEIIESLPALEQDPQKIWDLIEKYYHKGFFENVIFGQYGHLFEDNTEERYISDLNEIKEGVAQQLEQLYQQCQSQMKQMRSEYTEKVVEVYTLKNQYTAVAESVQKEEYEKAKQLFQDKEVQIFDRWDAERQSFMKEIRDWERHCENLVAKEKFRLFAFRWRIMKKVNKMGKFDRDSHDFMKTNLEVRELVSHDIDQMIQQRTKDLNEKCKAMQKEYDRMLLEVTDLRFQIKNLEKQVLIKDNIIEEYIMKDEMRDQNVRNFRERKREAEAEMELMQTDFRNMKDMLEDLQTQNKHLVEKINKIKDKKNMSVLDHKVLYNKTDKSLQKARLVEEINEALTACVKQLSKSDPSEKRNQQTSTELKNVNKVICYRADFGQGILQHSATQYEKQLGLNKEIQTELKKDEIGKIGQNSRPGSKFAKQQVNESKERLESRKSTIHQKQSHLMSIDKDSHRRSKQSSIDSRNRSQMRDNEPYQDYANSSIQVASNNEQRKFKSQFLENAYSRSSHNKKESSSNAGSQSHMDIDEEFRKSSALTNNDKKSLEDSQAQKANDNDDNTIQIEPDKYLQDEAQLSSSQEQLDLSQSGKQLMKKFRDITSKEIKSDLMKIINYNFPTDPKNVFCRLWNQNEQRQINLSKQRTEQQQKDETMWKTKLANSNCLQKTFNGLPVYTDPATGRSFIHLDDIRNKAQHALNDKPSYQHLLVQEVQEESKQLEIMTQDDLEPTQEEEPSVEMSDLSENLFVSKNQLQSPLSVYLPNITANLKQAKTVSRNAKIYTRGSENTRYMTAQSFHKSVDRSQHIFTPSVTNMKDCDSISNRQHSETRSGYTKKRIQSGIAYNLKRQQQIRNQSATQYNSLIKSYCQGQKVNALKKLQKQQKSQSPEKDQQPKTYLVSKLDNYQH